MKDYVKKRWYIKEKERLTAIKTFNNEWQYRAFASMIDRKNRKLIAILTALCSVAGYSILIPFFEVLK